MGLGRGLAVDDHDLVTLALDGLDGTEALEVVVEVDGDGGGGCGRVGKERRRTCKMNTMTSPIGQQNLNTI